MQVVILAAGSSSRFYPFNLTHKASVTLLGKSIIEHTLESVKKAGIRDVVFITDASDTMKRIVGDGSQFGLNITYIVQKEATGGGDALLLAKEFIKDDFFVIWANRVEFHEFSDVLQKAKKGKETGIVLVKETENIEGVGVVQLEGDSITAIVEKPDPTDAPSNLKIVGVYFLPKQFLTRLEQMPKEHYNFEKALEAYAHKGFLKAVKTTIETISLKYPWDILRVKEYLLHSVSSYRGKDVTIGEHVVLDGPVYIEEGVTIMDHVTIKGPCYIGKNVYIGNNVILRGGAILEEDVVIGANMEVKNSVIGKGTTTHAGFIGDSIIGKNCKLAAYFCTANVRLDRTSIKIKIGEKEVNTHRTSLGVIMGDNVKAGIRVSTMPGVVIGRNVLIGPQTTVMHAIEDDRSYYTKFFEVIEKKNS